MERIRELESKEIYLDSVVSKIREIDSSLKESLDDSLWGSPLAERSVWTLQSLSDEISGLLEKVEHTTTEFREKAKELGYYDVKLGKYVDSKYRGEKIDFIRVMISDEVIFFTSNQEGIVECDESHFNVSYSGDSIICDLQYHSEIEVIK